ncbi:hypothetical protein O181_035675 [Austropuccinia psidii MF-1]|uniref:Uncharacterized protein n=1 Tax=Austropuccinia psidii MF-1 TaxID=1389203 RepID=A0A9Q3D564_9BASI|nr:hypothetical protein [Austropuccinia psidii MF-1]
MEYKDHEGYTHDWVTLLPAFQLAYNTSQNSTTGETPALVEKGWNPLLPVDHVKKNLVTIHPTAKDFHDMWKRACNPAARCIAEAKEYNKEKCSGNQTHRGIFRKHQVFPVSLVKPYFQTEEDKFPSRKKNPTPPEILEVEDSSGPVKRIVKARKIRLNCKD